MSLVNRLVSSFTAWFRSLSMVVKFAFWSVVLLALVFATGTKAMKNNQNAATPDYEYWQGQYKDIAADLATSDAVREATKAKGFEVTQATIMQFPLIQQDGSTQLRVDRCQSCHTGLLNPQMTAENIIKSVDHVTIPTEQVADYLSKHAETLKIIKTLGAHPGIDIEGETQRDLGVIHGDNFTYGVTVDHSTNPSDAQDYQVQKFSMSKHPFPTFGCTTCHYGSGRDLVQETAHGNPEHWLAPMLGAKFMDAACAQCHIQYDTKNLAINYLQPLQSVTITVAPNASGKQPTGVVNIIDGSTQIGTGPLSSGKCTISYPTPSGKKPVIVAYTGDATYQPTTVSLADLTSAAPRARLASTGGSELSLSAQVSIPMMQTIVKGEQLFKQDACYGCHKIDGFSKGNVGPELTYEGRLAVPSTIEHQLWDPRYKVNSCVMPYFFSYRLLNTDNMTIDDAIANTNGLYAHPEGYSGLTSNDVVDWRAPGSKRATIEDEDTVESVTRHGYIPNAAMQADVDALATFVASQTGQNYSGAQADRMAMIAAFNVSSPATVPVTVAEGKLLFESSGCYACHTIGDPKWTKDPTRDPHAKGGVAGPQLTWEGSRHSQDWLVEHYKNPQAFVPNSVMPIFPFSDSQRKALSMYDQSLMPANPGARPVSADQDMPNPQLTKAGAQTPDVRYMTR